VKAEYTTEGFYGFSIQNWFLYKWWIEGRDETNDNVDEWSPCTVKLQDACNYA
jgi:hypothetical protein